MTMYALIEQTPEGTYTASVLGWPDVRAQGGTADEAVYTLHVALAEHLQHARIVPLDVEEKSPWLQTIGAFEHDTFADEFAGVIADYRRSLDAAEHASNTQDHAA